MPSSGAPSEPARSPARASISRGLAGSPAHRPRRAPPRMRRGSATARTSAISSSSANTLCRCSAAARCRGLALPLGERLVGDVADEVLQEAVLAALGRARDPTARPAPPCARAPRAAAPARLGSVPDTAASACTVNVLPSTAPSCSSRRSSRRDAVQAGGDQRVQRLRHLERLDLAGRPVHRPFLGEQAAVEQHPHRLDRVQRHALRAREDLVAQPLRQARARAPRAAPPSPSARAAPGRAR